MIKSIKFNGKQGYITNTIPEPECPVRWYGYKPMNKFTKEEKKQIKLWQKEHEYWEKHKNEFRLPHLVKNLLNKKIIFQDNKINIIFGPNGSGKTTIIKALAGNAGITDGFSTLVEPIVFRGWNEPSENDMRDFLNKQMLNTADIEWDGSIIYYDNFIDRTRRNELGELQGSIFNNIEDEALYLMMENKISQGQNRIFINNMLYEIAKEKKSYADLFKKYLNEDGTIKDDLGYNNVWNETFKTQLKYYLSFEKSYIKSPITFLFDEIDKSLDIENIYTLYTQTLPQLVKTTSSQVIVISHSPLVLSDKIRNNEFYHLISLDDDYTNDCLKALKKLF